MKEVLINNGSDTFLFKTQRFALCLYFFSIHFESWDPFFTGVDYLVTKVTITFYIVVSLLRFKGIKSYISYKKFTLPIIFIFLIEMVSGYNNQHYGYTEYFSLIFFLNIIIFLLMLMHNSSDKLAISKALNFFVYGGLILAIFFVLGIGVDNTFGGGRISVFGVNPNMLAVNLSIVLLIIIHRLFNRLILSELQRFIYIVFVPILIYFLAITGSRSGFIGFFGGILILLILRKTKNPIDKIMSLIIGGFATLLALYYFLTNEVIGGRLTNSIETGDLSGRDVYWEQMLDLTMINPVFGIGRTGYAYETDKIFGTYTSAHNAFLEILIMGGFVNLILFLIFIFAILKLAIIQYRYKNELIYLMLLAPMIVMILVGHPFGTKISWGIFAFIIVSKQFRNNVSINSKYVK